MHRALTLVAIATFLIGLCGPIPMAAQGLHTTSQGVTNITIMGTSDNAAGKQVGLYGYNDMLSQQEVLLDETTVEHDGAFTLRCYANYPRLVFVEIENYSQSFYVEPGRDYKVYLPEFDWSIDEQRNVFLEPEALPLRFLDLPTDELNLRIVKFEAIVDSFILANRVYFDPKFKPQKRYFDSLVVCLKKQGIKAGEENADGETFFDRYVACTLASIQLATRSTSRTKLIGRYITSKPVRYYDEQYMRLFFDLYAGSISHGTRRIPLHRLVAWVHHGDLHAYMDSIGLDPLLRNEQMRELAVLQALKESYFDRNYDPAEVKQMIEQLGEQSKFTEHRMLATQLATMLIAHEHGSEVPKFELPDIERHMVSLDSLKGSWTYLSFVRVGDPNCLAELETMAHFRDSLYARHSDVRFVSISCDREFQKMYLFLTNSKRGRRYNWLWLHFDGNYRLLERYGVVSYPTFILINPEGKLHYSVTPPPASGILLRGPWEKQAEYESEFTAPFINR